MSEPHGLNGPFEDPEPADAIETRLRSVRPAAPRIDRDRLMFLAGQRSARPARAVRLWPAAAVASWAACAALAGLLAARPERVVTEVRVVERAVERPTPVRVPSANEPSETSIVAAAPAPRGLTDASPPSGRGSSPTGILEYRRRFEAGDDLFASAGPPSRSADAKDSPPPTYGDLRRTWLADEPRGEGLLF